VPLRMKVDGVATDTRPFSIERIDADYRTVPGSNMYESFRQTLRIGGVMDESQQEELREAQEQLAELERQIEAMPAQQRAMMERMMGSQLETIRRMASGGGFEVETIIQEIRGNSDLPSREAHRSTLVPRRFAAIRRSGSPGRIPDRRSAGSR
jgi:TolA-binding protein